MRGAIRGMVKRPNRYTDQLKQSSNAEPLRVACLIGQRPDDLYSPPLFTFRRYQLSRLIVCAAAKQHAPIQGLCRCLIVGKYRGHRQCSSVVKTILGVSAAQSQNVRVCGPHRSIRSIGQSPRSRYSPTEDAHTRGTDASFHLLTVTCTPFWHLLAGGTMRTFSRKAAIIHMPASGVGQIQSFTWRLPKWSERRPTEMVSSAARPRGISALRSGSADQRLPADWSEFSRR